MVNRPAHRTRIFLKNRVSLTMTVLLISTHLLSAETFAADSAVRLNPRQPALRMPADLTMHQQKLFAANARSGTVSIVDPEHLCVQSEWKVANSLSGIASAGPFLIAVDNDQDVLRVLRYSDPSDELAIHQTIPTAMDPVEIAVSETGRIAVTSRWSRRVTIYSTDRNTDNTSAISHLCTADLSFAPHCLLFLPEDKLLVADAFAGQLAVLDSLSGEIVAAIDTHGHNIRGLSLSADGQQILIAHQSLNYESFISHEHVFWGDVMQNNLETRDLRDVLSPSKLTEESSRLTYPLGTPSVGSGDPDEIAVTRTGTTLLLLSGFQQVACRTDSHLPFFRLKVGRRPDAICMNDDQSRAYVANRFDDSLSVIELSGEQPKIAATISFGAGRSLTEVEIGEQKFFDASLSLDGWYSCHSCHTDGHTNGMLSDTLGDEGQGAPKKVISLLGTYNTGPWAWTGSKAKLEDQIRTSLLITMQSPLSEHELPVPQLAAYLNSLEPPPSVSTARGETQDSDLLEQGRKLFEAHGCAACHAGSLLTSASVYDVGLRDEAGTTEFNPPSLRGVSQRDRFFHNGTAKSLTDALKSGHHNSDDQLNDDEVTILRAYLNSL